MFTNAMAVPPDGVCGAFVCIFDSLISVLVIAPLSICAWRGIWQLLDIYLLPQNIEWSCAVSILIGIVFGVLLNYFQNAISKELCYEKRPVIYYAVSRIYTIFYTFVCINHWRGVWKAWDVVTGITLKSGALSTGIGLICLILTKGLVNISVPPLLVVPDYHETYFRMPNQFGIKVREWL